MKILCGKKNNCNLLEKHSLVCSMLLLNQQIGSVFLNKQKCNLTEFHTIKFAPKEYGDSLVAWVLI